MKHVKSSARAAFVGVLTAVPAATAQQVSAAAQPSSILDFMIPVEGGVVAIGSTAKDLYRSLEIINPVNLEGRIPDGRRFMAELGRREVDVPTFLMSRHVVTMEQYEVFVKQTGHRFPFDWWRYGAEEDYTSKLREIRDEFKDAGSDAPLEYWKQHWQELPYSIPKTQDGEPMDKYPVVYVSWRDAVAFAAWAGMRLPTEAEWLRAAKAGEEKEFLWGDDLDAVPVPRNNTYMKPTPVGELGEATRGPYGHEDMVLQVFEWVGDTGFFPFDEDEFDKERDRFLNLIKKDLARSKSLRPRLEELERYRPEWRGTARVAKGGWYGSTKEQLRLGLRVPSADYQVRSGLGFRVAKSHVPARDMSLSAIRLDYDMSYFGDDREPNLEDQVGAEHYDIVGGLIAGYTAVSVVPINFMTEKRPTIDKLKTDSLEKPLVIGTLIVTIKLAEPAIDRGTYTILYREDGVPNDLSKAWRNARSDIAKAKKSRKKDGEDDGEPKQNEWQKVLTKYGLTEADVEANEVCKFIRPKPGDYEVPVDVARYILRDHLGQHVASWPARAHIVAKSGYEDGAATCEIVRAENGEPDVARFKFGVPTYPKSRGKVYFFDLDLELDWP